MNPANPLPFSLARLYVRACAGGGERGLSTTAKSHARRRQSDFAVAARIICISVPALETTRPPTVLHRRDCDAERRKGTMNKMNVEHGEIKQCVEAPVWGRD